MKKVTELKPEYHGKKFRAIKDATPIKGKISYECGKYYFCQDKYDGVSCPDRLGFKYSWQASPTLSNSSFEEVEIEDDTQWVWVSDSSEERARELKGKRILLAKIEGADFPFITVASGEMDKYLSGNKYAITKWKYAVPVEEEEWKPVHICLNNNHTAVVFEDEVHVGCQIFSFELIELLHEAVQKAKQFKNDNK